MDAARGGQEAHDLGIGSGDFAYVTLHRPANVEERENLSAILEHLQAISGRMPVVFPMHPRTRKMISGFGLEAGGRSNLKIVDPVGYHDSIFLCKNARLVLTDSGGLQEEATFFSTPCLTLRPNTERPVTLTVGSNRLTAVDRLNVDILQLSNGPRRLGKVPPLWDGRTSERIISALVELS